VNTSVCLRPAAGDTDSDVPERPAEDTRVEGLGRLEMAGYEFDADDPAHVMQRIGQRVQRPEGSREAERSRHGSRDEEPW
jgi:hypothetical protein